VDQPRDRIAAEAVRLLAAASDAGPADVTPARAAAHIALAPRLVVRDSTLGSTVGGPRNTASESGYLSG
jgi:LacI family transcriptional regulator